MSLKKRVDVIDKKIAPPVDPDEEARQAKLWERIREARTRTGIQDRKPLVYDFKPGSLAESLQAARRAHSEIMELR